MGEDLKRRGGELPDVRGADFSVLLPSENVAASARMRATSSTGTRMGRAGRGDRCRPALIHRSLESS